MYKRQVQATVRDAVVKGMFDRAWVIVCRDASQPVGYIRALRASEADAAQRLAAARDPNICLLYTSRCV